jgi:uncharacterized protein YbjQ (UPF0145 family)
VNVTDEPERCLNKAIEAVNQGANAIIGLDMETSDIGQASIILISATGTAVVIESE